VTVTYIYAGTNAGSSITYTSGNYSSENRHWNAAVLWDTPSEGTAASD
jgi:hypothetical protein